VVFCVGVSGSQPNIGPQWLRKTSGPPSNITWVIHHRCLRSRLGGRSGIIGLPSLQEVMAPSFEVEDAGLV
jgi:hypothetical protein